jgi:hypothetical protein
VADKFKIAEGYVEISADIDERQAKKSADKAGDKAGDSFEDSFTKSVSSKLKSSNPVQKGTGKASSAAGKSSGDSFASKFTSTILGGLRTKLLPMIGTIGGAIGAGLNAAIAAGPFLAKAGGWLWNIVSAAGAAAPALLALGVSGGIVVATLKAIGPAVGKALTPMATAWKSASKEAGLYASRGLRPLAKEFVKANFPMVRTTMNQIATATNKVVSSVIRWTNTVKGQQAITDILASTGAAVERLGPHVSRLATSFLDMLGRISGVSLAAGEAGLSGVLDRLSGWMDKVTSESVQSGLDRLKESFRQVAAAVQATGAFIQRVISFYRQYKTEIMLISDALGILAIVFGGPITAILAGIGLVVRHFDLIKAAWGRVIAYFRTADGSAVLDNLKAAWNRVWPALQQGFQAIAKAVIPKLKQLWSVIKKELIPAFAAFLAAAAPLVAWFVKKMGPQIGSALGRVLSAVRGFVRVIAGIFQVLTGILTGNWRTAWAGVKKIVSGAVSAILALLGTTPSKVRARLGRVKGAVTGAFGGAGRWLANAGKQIIGGLVSGITSRIGEVRSTLGNLTSMIPQWKGPKKKDKKLLYDVGRTIIGGLVSGFQSAAPGVAAYLRKFTDRIADKKVSARVRKQLQQIATATNNTLKGLNSRLGAVTSKLAAARDRYKDLVAAAKDYAASLKEQSMGQLSSFVNPNGETTGAGLVQGLKDRVASSGAFLANIKKLKSLGLNKDYLQQILELGVDNGGDSLANAILSDPSQVGTINALQRQLSAIGDATGKFGSDTFHKAGIDAAAGLVRGLQSQEAKLVAAINRLATKLVTAFKKKLKINSPSKVVADEVGAQLPPGAVVGVRRAMPAAQRKIAALAPRLSAAVTAGVTGGGSSRGGGVSIGELHVHLQGMLDPTNPTAARKLAAQLYNLLHDYEKSYA